MCRSFTGESVDADVLHALLACALRAPSAGNSQGTEIVLLVGDDETSRYWDVTLPAERRETFRWKGLLRAPVLLVVVADPGAYVRRYSEADKAATGLGRGQDAWPVPYWYVDAGAVVQNLLLLAVDAGLGACFFGMFDHAPAVFDSLEIPPDRVAVGTVALGHPAPDEPGRSQRRPRRAFDEVVHRGVWTAG